MDEEQILAKRNRMNMLFDFYEPLLTGRQQTFLKHYFQDDFSLVEIASYFNISRQAVYEHIKRAEQMLESYEVKLGLLSMFEHRTEIIEALQSALHEMDGIPAPQRTELQTIISELQALN